MRKTGDPGFLVVLHVGSGSFHGVGLPETSYCSKALVYKSLCHCIHMLICQDTMQESAVPLRVSLGGSHTYLLSYAISPVLVLIFKVSICLNFLLWKLPRWCCWRCPWPWLLVPSPASIPRQLVCYSAVIFTWFLVLYNGWEALHQCGFLVLSTKYSESDPHL